MVLPVDRIPVSICCAKRRATSFTHEYLIRVGTLLIPINSRKPAPWWRSDAQTPPSACTPSPTRRSRSTPPCVFSVQIHAIHVGIINSGLSEGGARVISLRHNIFFKRACMYVCMCGHHIQQNMDQQGKAANPARGQLNRENEHFRVQVHA